MVDKETGYAIMHSIAVPMDMLMEIAKRGFSVDYEYEDGEHQYRAKGTVENIKLVSGEQLLANQVAYRLRKDRK